jgi:hypothetical protein
VEDVDNCAFQIESIPIAQPDTIAFFSFDNNYIRRKGDSTGSMTASIRYGNGKYNYEWYALKDNTLVGRGKSIEFAPINLNNQYAGEYLLRVRDTANCYVNPDGWLEHRFIIAEPDKDLSIDSVSIRPVSCFGLHDGSFQVQASGGWSSAYTYGLDTVNMYASNTFSNHRADTLLVFVRDNAGVIASKEIIVTQPPVLTASIASHTDALCYGSADGTATLDIKGGNYPNYEISSDGITWTKGYTINTLGMGNQTIRVRDYLGCDTSVSVVINEPPDITVQSRTIINTKCGSANGSIIANLTGGTPGYVYSWSLNGNTIPGASNSISDLYSGAYLLHAMDMHNCSRTFTFNVSDLTDLTIDTIITQRVSCWGRSDGSASIQISKGNPPYGITWPDSSHNTSVIGLPAGDYYVLVTDVEKCKVFHDFTIATPLNMTLTSTTLTNPLCEGVENGGLIIEASDEFGGYNYVWSNGKNGNSINGLSPGNYQVTVTDANNCSNTFDFIMHYQYTIKPDLGRDLTLCKGNSFYLNPGTFSNYLWSSDNGITSREPILAVNKAGNYYVEVRDNYGCTGRDTIKIDESLTELTGKLLIATNIGQNDTVMIFEASWPIPDSVEFHLEGCNVLSSGLYYREVIFADTGTFTIGLTSYRENCLDIVSKTVKVEQQKNILKSAPSRLIQLFVVSPNPNAGMFQAEIRLRESAPVTLRLLNLATGVMIDIKKYKGSDLYYINYSKEYLASGTYLLHLQAGNEAKARTIIIQK